MVCTSDTLELHVEVFKLLVQRHVDHVREDEGKEITEDEALGQLVAKFTKWNGVRILEVAATALEDANFHSECEIVEKMAREIEESLKQK